MHIYGFITCTCTLLYLQYMCVVSNVCVCVCIANNYVVTLYATQNLLILLIPGVLVQIFPMVLKVLVAVPIALRKISIFS